MQSNESNASSAETEYSATSAGSVVSMANEPGIPNDLNSVTAQGRYYQVKTGKSNLPDELLGSGGQDRTSN